MENLAGWPTEEADPVVEEELRLAGICPVFHRPSKGEVKASVEGELGNIKLRRAWYYWVASGQISLGTALEIYYNPIGREYIRAGGHCGAPDPREYGVTWAKKDGRKVVVWTPSELESFRKWKSGEYSDSSLLCKVMERVQRTCIFVNTKEEQIAASERAYVDLYHIDTQEGLNVFADIIKKYEL